MGGLFARRVELKPNREPNARPASGEIQAIHTGPCSVTERGLPERIGIGCGRHPETLKTGSRGFYFGLELSALDRLSP